MDRLILDRFRSRERVRCNLRSENLCARERGKLRGDHRGDHLVSEAQMLHARIRIS